MNIDYDRGFVLLSDVPPGGVFVYHGSFYLRTYDTRSTSGVTYRAVVTYHAVLLTNGRLTSLPDGTLVESLPDAVLRRKEEPKEEEDWGDE